MTAPHELLQLRSVEDFERALEESATRPLLIFKNSFTCGTSAAALDELLDHMAGSRSDVRYAMVTVQTERAVSNVIAQRLGVRHETPQVLLVRNRRVEWSASHFRVNAESLAHALSRWPAPPPTPTTTPTES